MRKHEGLFSSIAVGLLALFFVGCQQKPAPAFERPPAPVSVVESVSRDVPTYLDEIGKSVAREVVSIQPQISGRITEIHFADGADIKIGDPLFTIDPRPFEADLQKAEANLAKDTALKKQAEANLMKDIVQTKNAEIQVERYAKLVEQGVVSKEQFDQIKTNAEALNALVNADRAAIQSAEEAMRVDRAAIETTKVQLGYCYIRSPINGRSGHRLVDLGNVVTPDSGTPLLVIERLDPIYADFTITQDNLSAVQQNMAQRTLRVEVRLPDEPDKPRIGEFTFLDNTVQDNTGTVKLRATVPNSDHRFWPGRFVKIRLVLGTKQGAVLVPAAAPQLSAKGPFVYVVKEDSTAELRPVTLGQRQGELVVIDKGLKAGERVVVNGHIAVTPGGKVRIEEPRSLDGLSATSAGGKL
jgi:membrane fusion protein, multidrug efflux system